MAQKILLKRGLETNRSGFTPDTGEILYTTDNKEVFLGDGSTLGGNQIGYLALRDQGSAQTIGGDVVVSGNLTVNGTTTTVNSNEVNIGDAVILLNSDETGTASQDAGFEIERGTDSNVSLLWNETSDYWQITDTTGTRRILDTNDIKTSADYTLDGLGDTTITTNTTGEILKWNGSAWVNNTLSEAGIQAQDNDLDAIAAIAGTSGLLKKTAADTWTLDTTTYGTITSITAGTGLGGGGTTGTVDLSVNVDGSTIEITTDTLNVKANGITTTELNVADTGTSGNVLTSDGLGGFTWGDAGAAVNNSTITLSAGTGLKTGGSFSTNQASNSTITFDLDLNELTTSIDDANGDYFAVVDSFDGAQYKLTKANIALSGFNNDSGWTSNTGTVTSVTAGAGMTQSGTASVNPTLDVVAGDSSLVVSADSMVVGTVDGGTF